jgi:hypothetical protein
MRGLPRSHMLRGMHEMEWAQMDDATDANKVVAAIFAAGMCAAKDSKHEDYVAEYEAFLGLLEARDARARAAADEVRQAFPQIGAAVKMPDGGQPGTPRS